MPGKLYILLLMVGMMPTLLFAEGAARFEWQAFPGIIEYHVKIKDSNEKIVFDKKTSTNHVTFSLPPGLYKINVDSTTKFNKPGPSTGWESIEIIKKVSRSKNIADYRYDLKLGLGGLYAMLRPDYNNFVHDTYVALNLNVAYLFDYSFFRFMGLEFENTYEYHVGKDNLENSGLMARINLTGLNLFFRTNFTFPLNIIFRAGGGVAYTAYQYTLNNETTGGQDVEYSISSTDYYYKLGVSLEFTLFSTIFIEPGAEYIAVNYRNNSMSMYQFFCRLGMLYNFSKEKPGTRQPQKDDGKGVELFHYISLQTGFVPLHTIAYSSGGGLGYYGIPFKLGYALFWRDFGLGIGLEYLLLSDNVFNYSFIIPGLDVKYSINWGLYAGIGASYRYSLGMGIVDQSVQQSTQEALNFKRRHDWWGSLFVGYNLFLGGFFLNAETRCGYNFTKGMFSNYELNNIASSKDIYYTFEVSLYLGAGIKI